MVPQMMAMGAVFSPMRGESWQWWWWLLFCWLLGSGVGSLSELCGMLRVFHVRVQEGVSLLCDALRLHPAAHRRVGPEYHIHHADEQIPLLVYMPQPTPLENPRDTFSVTLLQCDD
jgi:hypothetical protein